MISLRVCAAFDAPRNHRVTFHYRQLPLTCTCVLLLLLVSQSHAKVSVNLPLDDPAYPLLEKLVTSNLTFINALTIKPITRLYAARLVAEAIQQRRNELETAQRQDPFLDWILQYLAGRFKQELQQLRFFYRPRRPGPLFLAPLAELKLDAAFASEQFVQRDSSGLTTNLQGVFGLNEGFAYGNALSLRTRSISWGTLWEHVAAYVEPDMRLRTDPILGDTFDTTLHKGYLKVGQMNLELEFGRDTLWWGPASQGDLVLSNNAPPFDLLKLSTPTPFRLPGLLHHLGEWQAAYFVTRLEAERAIPHPLVSGLRVTAQPTSFLKFGFTNVIQAFGEEGARLSPLAFMEKLFVPTLDATAQSINGLVAYDLVLSLPFAREITMLNGLKFYWQRGQDNVSHVRGILGGGNILGGVLDGGRWDLRVEFADTRDDRAVWYTHPTYRSGFAFKQFVIGHPIGGAAEGFFVRATYYLTPTAWLAADGRYEQYGFDVQPDVTTQQRFGLEGSYQFSLQQKHLVLWSRLEYATLDAPATALQHTFVLLFTARWRF